MYSTETSTQIVQTIGKEFYQDLFQPTTKELGYVLGRIAHVLRIITIPTGAIGDCTPYLEEKLKNFIMKSFKKTQKEKRIIPDPTIICPLLENVTNAFNRDDLVLFYSNLLASSTDKEKIEAVHPSFINIITQLSKTDIILLNKLSENSTLPFTKIDKTDVNYIAYFKLNNKIHHLNILEPIILLDNFDDTNLIAYNISIQNLIRLGLIIDVNVDIANKKTEQIYKRIYNLKSLNIHNGLKSVFNQNKLIFKHQELNLKYGAYIATLLGKDFIDTCTNKSVHLD